MEGYKTTIRFASKELTPKERVAIKDTGNCISLDEATAEQNITIDYAAHVILDIHNERSDNKDYTKCIVIAKDGTKYITGSESFTTALTDIVDEMTDCGCADEIAIEVYRKESKNYKGKSFITCSLI